MTTHGGVAKSMRQTIEYLREANAGKVEAELAEVRQRAEAAEAERDALRAFMEKAMPCHCQPKDDRVCGRCAALGLEVK